MTDDSPENSGGNEINLSASGVGRGRGIARLSYASGFPKQQLQYAIHARDKSGEIEAIFVGDHNDKISTQVKREHERNVVSAVVNSIGFLEGQKYWFIYRLEDRDWDFENIVEIQETGWNGLEDAFVRMLEVSRGNSEIIKNTDLYHGVKALREFRNDLLHFESPFVVAGEESEEYDVNAKFEELDISENLITPHSTYPFKWFSYDLAEWSVRMCFSYWRFFARGLDMEDELLKAVPRP